MTKNGPGGTYLTDGSGKTLYVFASDTGNTSNCTGACAAAWPPLTVSGSAKAGSGATASDVGTTKRSDGKTQVTYAGHPLYYYAGDSAAGQMNGQGINQFGGVWYIVDASGKSITAAASSSSSGTGAGGAWS
jgi:predicted lipoprotein with Yx(FWY)xxD motif